MTRLRHLVPKALLLVVLLVGSALSLLWGAVATQPTTRIPCAVERVVDGDTLVCSDAGRVRLLLIDAPELDQEPFGELAKTALEGLLPTGLKVDLETDVQTHDQYDRLLAYVHLPDGRIVNEVLLDMGVAVGSVYPPNVRHVDRFRSIVEAAREAKRGLWAVGAFECLPSDHRSGRC
jgi:micrococcal nuclease